MVELTGHSDDPSTGSDPYDGIAKVLIVDGTGKIPALRIPWNNAQNGNSGYVVYGLPRPQGTIAFAGTRVVGSATYRNARSKGPAISMA